MRAARCVQAVFRGTRARTALSCMRAAATALQAQWRARAGVLSFAKTIGAARAIQAAARCANAVRLLAAARDACIAIQAAWRGEQCRVWLATMHAAAAAVQAVARALPCRRALAEALGAATLVFHQEIVNRLLRTRFRTEHDGNEIADRARARELNCALRAALSLSAREKSITVFSCCFHVTVACTRKVNNVSV